MTQQRDPEVPARTDAAAPPASTRSGLVADLPTAGVTSPRHQPHEGPLRVLVGKERFSENHAWSEMPQHWPSGVADRAVIEVVGQAASRRLGDALAGYLDHQPPAGLLR